MEEKKIIKMSFGMVICIIIIILLIISLGVVYYLGFIKNSQKVNEIEIQNKQVEVQKNELNEKEEKNNEINKTDSNISILSNSEVQSMLGSNEAKFCIENIEKSGKEYIITAYLLENNARVISKSEYDTLKNGGEINFRNQKWKISEKTYDESTNWEYIKSGNDELGLLYNINNQNGFLENNAGIASEGLNDYSKKEIKFKVSKDILIGGFWWNFKYDNNGKISAYDISNDEIITDATKSMSFEELSILSKGCKGTYDECVAYVQNGVVEAIRIYAK